VAGCVQALFKQSGSMPFPSVLGSCILVSA
jgi:hypothetical protein